MRLILASASPRRRELLRQIGVEFDVEAVDIDETPEVDESPLDYVRRMAEEKAKACWTNQQHDNAVAIIGSDTSVIIDGEILGKPADFQAAEAMLKRLSGRAHQVMTSVCLLVGDAGSNSSPAIDCQVVTTDVYFKPVDEQQIAAYWHSGEPQDKAGSYGIQGFGALLVERIDGSYSAVVGLPLAEVGEMLKNAGIATWQITKAEM